MDQKSNYLNLGMASKKGFNFSLKVSRLDKKTLK